MLQMILLLALALIITVVVFWLNRFLPFKVCSLCVGVSGSWLLATLGALGGFLELENFRMPILIMMGGTAVGIAFQGQERLGFAQKSVWRWKIPATLAGLGVFYWFFLNMSWPVFTVEVILLGFLTFIFFIRKNARSAGLDKEKFDEKLKELEEKLKQCC